MATPFHSPSFRLAKRSGGCKNLTRTPFIGYNRPIFRTDVSSSQHNLPPILNSQAYKDGGIIFITWDEGEGGDGPIGMIVLSPDAKGAGYSNSIHYTHSSTLRTLQEIFGVTPLLGGATTAIDLSDLFKTFP
jgi:hypothetical protein